MARRQAHPPTRREARRQRRPVVSIVLAFLAGVVLTTLGAVALLGLGIATVGDAEDAMDATPSPAATSTEDRSAEATGETPEATAAEDATSSPGSGSDGDGDVPEPCVRAAEYNQTLNEAIDEMALGARDQDARSLQESLDAVQDARPEGESASDECLELAGTSE